MKQSREWSSAPQHLGVVAIEKGAFGLPSTKVANFTDFYLILTIQIVFFRLTYIKLHIKIFYLYIIHLTQCFRENSLSLYRFFNCFKCFGFFCGVMTEFELVKPKFPNKTTMQVYLCGFPITHRVKQCTTCQRANNHDTTNRVDIFLGLNYFEQA